MSTPYYLRAGDPNRPRVLENLIRMLQGLDDKHTYVVESKRYQKPRTNKQNSALWGVAYPALRQQTGNDADSLHEYFCGEFFSWVIVEVMGYEKKVPRRTTTHDENGKKDVMGSLWFCDFYDFIQQRSSENGYEVPDPDPMWKLYKEELRAQAVKPSLTGDV